MARKFIDLKTWCENNNRLDILNEWDAASNNAEAESVPFSGSKIYKWVCNKGHSYEKSTNKRTNCDIGCPYCTNRKVLVGFNDLETTDPDIADLWDYEKNCSLTPNGITRTSHKKVWWTGKCGHSWQALVYAKTRDNKYSNCPRCNAQETFKRIRKETIDSGKTLANLYPEISKEWSDRNTVSPEGINPWGPEKYWWKCKDCGHEWQSKINNRIYNHQGCPRCRKKNHTSFPEQCIYYYVKKCFEDAVWSFRDFGYEIDIYIPSLKIGIEYDGSRWHNNPVASERDARKDIKCLNDGIALWRVKELESFKEATFDTDKVFFCVRKNMNSLSQTIKTILRRLDKKVDIDIERDKNEIRSLYLLGIEKNNLAANYPEIAKEWDYEANFPITPDKVTYGSDDKYSWICSKCGNRYEASLSHRTIDKTGCPYCRPGARKIVKGFNDFETWCSKTDNKHLLQEWDYEKNEIRPDQIRKGSEINIWWKCRKCSNSWSALVYSRTQESIKAGCPVCGRLHGKKGKHVVCVETGEKFLSVLQASKKHNISSYRINRCLDNPDCSVNGYHWHLEED